MAPACARTKIERFSCAVNGCHTLVLFREYKPLRTVPKEGTMSTASRNCGTVCSARGWGSNAPLVPGVSGKPWGHYDPCALRQLGGPPRTEPKCKPEVKIAAFVSRSSAHKPLPYPRGARLRHSPPFISLSQPPPPLELPHV